MTDELYSAIVQWLHLFPAFQSNPIYIFGESYGAKFAIQVATKIHNENYFGALKSTTIAAQKVTIPISKLTPTLVFFYRVINAH